MLLKPDLKLWNLWTFKKIVIFYKLLAKMKYRTENNPTSDSGWGLKA